MKRGPELLPSLPPPLPASNREHGKPLTLKERKGAARLKLRRHTERSNNWIAQDCGISDHTVGDIREELESTSQIAKLLKLLSRDRKWYPREMPKEGDETMGERERRATWPDLWKR